jgi:hypothetical protein
MGQRTAESRYYDFRHFYASALIEVRESVITVYARLGHATAVGTLESYGHLRPDNEESTRTAIEAAWRDAPAVVAPERRQSDARATSERQSQAEACCSPAFT